MRNQAAKNFIWNMVGTSINCCASLIYLIIITRVNKIDTSGIFSFCFSYSLIFYIISNLGNRVYQVSDKTEYSDSTYLTLKIFTCSAAFILALIFSFIANYSSEKILLIFIFMIVRSIEAFSDSFYAVWQKKERLDFVGISYTLKTIASIIIFAVVDIITKNIVLAVAGMLLGTLLTFLFCDCIIIKKFDGFVFEGNPGRSFMLFKSTSFFVAFNLLIMLITNIPRFIVDFRFSDAQLGYFGILMMIPTTMLLLGQLIIQPYLNRITDSFNTGEYASARKIIRLMITALIFLALICCAAAFFIGPFALKLLYGIPFEKYRIEMTILIISGTFGVFTTLFSTMLTVMRKTRQQLFAYLSVTAAETVIVWLSTLTGNFSFVFYAYLAVMILQSIIFYIIYIYYFKAFQNQLLKSRCH